MSTRQTRRQRKIEQEERQEEENVNVTWSAMDPELVQTFMDILYKHPMAYKCKELVLNYLTSRDITVNTEDGRKIVWNQDFDYKLQKKYKKFIRDAYETHLILGVVPIVFISDRQGRYYPVVPKLQTYIIQTAYVIELEENVYRIWRPKRYLALERSLDAPKERRGFFGDNRMSGGAALLNFLNQGNNGGAAGLTGDRDAYQNPAGSGVGRAGWFIDHSISVRNIFQANTGPCGEIFSPLLTVLEHYYLNQYLLDSLFRREHKLLRPTHYVESRPKTNLDGHSENGAGTGDNGMAKTRKYVSKSNGPAVSMEDSLSDILKPLPPLNTLSQADQRSIEMTAAAVERHRRELNGTGHLNKFGAPLARQIERDFVSSLLGEDQEKVRYAPKNHTFHSKGAEPAIHAADRYETSRDTLDAVIAGVMGVPVALVRNDQKNVMTKDGFRHDMDIFRDKISKLTCDLHHILTAAFREILNPERVSERIASFKPLSLDIERIEAAKGKRPRTTEGYARTHNNGFGDIHDGTPQYSIPTKYVEIKKADNLVKGVYDDNGRIKKVNDEQIAGGKTDKVGKTEKKGTETTTVTTEGKSDEVAEGVVKVVVPSLRSEANIIQEYEQHDEQFKAPFLREKMGEGEEFESGRKEYEAMVKENWYNQKLSSPNNLKRKRSEDKANETDIDFYTCEVRLDPLPFVVEMEVLDRLLGAGVLSQERYKEFLAQQAGIPGPKHLGGVKQAEQNQEFCWMVSGQYNEEQARIREKRLDFELEMKKLKFQAEEQEKQRKADAKLKEKEKQIAEKTQNSTAASGGSSNATSTQPKTPTTSGNSKSSTNTNGGPTSATSTNLSITTKSPGGESGKIDLKIQNSGSKKKK